MDRRTFLHRMGTTLGASLGAASLGGCAGLAAARRTDGSIDISAYVQAMDEQVGRIHALPDRPEVEALLAKKQLPSGFLKRYMASLFVVAAFRDLPRHAQRDQLLQDRIWVEGPWLGEAQLRLARLLRRLPKTERKSLRRAIKEDRKAMDGVREGLIEGALGTTVEPERAEQLIGLYDQVLFRMRTQDPGILIDETLGTLARRAASVGATEDTWDDLLAGEEPLDLADLKRHVGALEESRLAAGGAPLFGTPEELTDPSVPGGRTSPRFSFADTRTQPREPEVGPPTDDTWVDSWGGSPKAAKLATTGFVLMGIGLALLPAGIILSIVALTLVFPLGMATVGAILSIMGAIYLATAATEARGAAGKHQGAPLD